MLVLVLRKHRLLLVLQVGMVLSGRGLSVFGGEDDKDTGCDLVVDDGLVIFPDNVDTKLDNVFRLELARLRLDRLGRETVAIDKSTVGRLDVLDVYLYRGVLRRHRNGVEKNRYRNEKD